MNKYMLPNFLITLIVGLISNCTKPDYEFIEHNPYMGGQYYVATWGDDENPGTFEQPFATLQTAINLSQPGDTTYIRGGVYHITSPQSINPDRRHSTAVSGTRENPIHYFNYPGEEPIFDGSEMVVLFPQGIHMNRVQYLKFRGITVRNIPQNLIERDPAEIAMGWTMSRTANITFERCTAHDIGGRGWSMVPGSGAWNGPVAWDYDTTRWINCDAYNLADALSATPGNGADGWKVHGYQHNVFIWEGCRAWNYSDDGFDASGQAYRYFYNNWTMATNKYAHLSDAEFNGFKLTGVSDAYYYPEYLEDTIIAKFINNIAVFCEGGPGFYNNIGTGLQNNAYFFNNLAYSNNTGFSCQSFSSKYPNLPGWNTSTFRNNISYGNKSITYDNIQIWRADYDHANSNTWLPTGTWPGSTPNTDFTLDAAAFTSLDSMTIMNEMTAPRKSDGSLPDIKWARLVPRSDMKGAGSYVGMSENPDIGVDWNYLDRM